MGLSRSSVRLSRCIGRLGRGCSNRPTKRASVTSARLRGFGLRTAAAGGGIAYKGLIIDCGYRMDVLVEGRILALA